MESSKNYFPVNALAPKEEGFTVFVKKVTGPKSDGFAVVDNGKIFVIDVGKADDVELIDYLLSLRESWLDGKPLPDDKPARLELTLIVSHPHPDHIAALPLLLEDERFSEAARDARARYLDTLTVGALLKKYDAGFVKYLLDAEEERAEEERMPEELTVEVRVVE